MQCTKIFFFENLGGDIWTFFDPFIKEVRHIYVMVYPPIVDTIEVIKGNEDISNLDTDSKMAAISGP